MVHKHTLHALLAILLWFSGTGISSAQVQLNTKRAGTDLQLRLAQSYERSGDYDAALKIYQKLYAQDSSNGPVADALRRTFLQLKRYDEAIALLGHLIAETPNDIGLVAQLGSIYYLKSDEKKAMELWERALAIDPVHPSTYVLVVSAITQSRLFDTAIAFYQRARTTCSDPTLFTADIAYLYSITLKYNEATREYLAYARQNPTQLGFVQARIGTYTGRKEGLSAATTVVEEAAHAESDNLSVQRLLAWVYLEGKKFDKAYDVYRSIDEKTKAGGHELLAFAQRALHEGAYVASSHAFQEIVDHYPSFDRIAEVKYGYAQSLEASDDQRDTTRLFGSSSPFPPKERTETDPRLLFTGAIAAYERIVTEFPNTEIAARSLLRTGIIKQEKFFDLDGAHSTFESLLKQYPRFVQISMEATVRLGDVNLALGSLEEAQADYEAVAGHGLLVTPLQEQAGLHIAEISYFKGDFNGAIEKLKALTGNAVSDATNDALSLQIFIQENVRDNEAVLKEFAKGDLLRRQRRLPEALALFESLVSTNPKADFADEALINAGDIQTYMARYPDAVVTYQRLLTDFPESISLDRTLMKLANVYEYGIKDPAKAIATYGVLLEKYPSSVYTSEARKRIRELRGDNI